MNFKNKLAKAIRVISVPPLLIMLLLILLYAFRRDIFGNPWDLLCMLVLLGIVPILAYPLQAVLPGWKEKGREGQRKLAFVLSIIGYTAAMAAGYLMNVSKELQLICNTYFISVVLLTVCNKLLHIRASGHACSMTGPLVFLIYFIGWQYFPVSLIVAAAVIWSSLYLKRHTVKDLILGILVCLIAFACALGISYFSSSL